MARAIASGGSAKLVARAFFELRFHLWICHAFREVRVHEPRVK